MVQRELMIMMAFLTVGTWANLALISCIVVEHYGWDVKREVALLVTPDHRVPVEAAQIPVHAEPKVVFRPLNQPSLVYHAARQRHSWPNNRCLILFKQSSMNVQTLSFNLIYWPAAPWQISALVSLDCCCRCCETFPWPLEMSRAIFSTAGRATAYRNSYCVC